MVTRKSIKEINRLTIKEKVRERLVEFRQQKQQENFNQLRNIQTNTEQVKAAVKNAQQEQLQRQQQGGNGGYSAGVCQEDIYLSEEEQEQLVQELMLEIIVRNQESLQEYEQGSVDYVAQDLQRQQETREAGEVLMPCPVCQSTYLQENNNFVGCPLDEYYLQTTIVELQAKLGAILSNHYNNGCMGAVHFVSEQKFSCTNLVMMCEQCGCRKDVL
eukprot:TRINITY_DN2211_c0_g2_i1.p1 TRINITY_DN2211_c0_g2~~TRINITY_DN2211_c0_g2_i1.p1  ORF type:complete len:216 (-),score=24.64 TRINITY_DN2211_c0_g2_i1:637-1284(-)